MTIEQDLKDLEDLTELLQNTTTPEQMRKWITNWKINYNDDNTGDIFPSVADMQIEFNSQKQVWATKELFKTYRTASPRMIRLMMQVF